ncbi:elongation of fatty acids protein 3-like [Humulus lupulus]|uniref:elongation of fatty acids protein 3-like n=1 Tax=Humulus lupulus TaxID=3486 RepID=UPI002B41347C|nr:elongation of fatty acids protein 3-like [Humulus lupulus]
MNSVVSALKYWLVDHPTILHFEWTQAQTLGSTPRFLATTVLTYLTLTLLLSRSQLPPLTPKLLKPITAVHSLILLVLSLIMAVGCSLSILRSDWTTVICFPMDTKPSGPLFFWAQVFYLSKLLEFGDTLLIILGGSLRRLSFLHVYHHATVVVMCYLWLKTSQSLFPVALVTNASVHVIMYGYYFLCAVGIRPGWKRVVTDCQIVQFVFSFAVSGRMLYLHFCGSGCSGMWGWCFNAGFNASLLALFANFHAKSYAKRTKIEEGVGHPRDKDKGA